MVLQCALPPAPSGGMSSFSPGPVAPEKSSKKPRYLSVYVEDAKKHGVLEAVLVRNLEFKTQPLNVSNPVTDPTGRIYGEMSAVKLTSPRKSDNVVGDIKVGILPFGRQAVQEAISKLKSTGIFDFNFEIASCTA